VSDDFGLDTEVNVGPATCRQFWQTEGQSLVSRTLRRDKDSAHKVCAAVSMLYSCTKWSVSSDTWQTPRPL